MERSLQFHNSADSFTVMNALQHSNLYPDRLLGEPQRRVGADAAAREAIAIVSRHGAHGYWIHFDADVLDDDIMPAVDYRMPNGLTWTEIEAVLHVALEHPQAVGMEVTILNPTLDADGQIVRAFAGMLSRCLSR